MDRSDLITIDPDILGGVPVFKGTHVPIKTLFEYLENNLLTRRIFGVLPYRKPRGGTSSIGML